MEGRPTRDVGQWEWERQPVSGQEEILASHRGTTPGHLNNCIGWCNARTSISPHHMLDKLLRAHGGCLGTQCRRRTWYTAQSSGEVCATVRAGDVRMGKPAWGHAHACGAEYIGVAGEPGELKHLSTRRKRDDSLSSGERKGSSLNRPACRPGL